MSRTFYSAGRVILIASALLMVLMASVVLAREERVDANRLPIITTASAADSTTASAVAAQAHPPLLCRLGANFAPQEVGQSVAITKYDVASLGLGWYINYGATKDAPEPDGIEYTPMIRIRREEIGNSGTFTYTYFPSGNALKAVLADDPEATVFVGNEPDRIGEANLQDDTEPELYAAAYHDAYYAIKAVAPNAKVAAGSIVQPTEVRLEYLDLVLASYQEQFGEKMPVDIWSIHNFVLNEASCAHYQDNWVCWGADIPRGINKIDGLRIGLERHDDIGLFKEQILRFRRWMKTNGYGGLPVYLSEFGVLLPDIYGDLKDFSPAAVNNFMNQSFDFILNTKDTELGDPNDGYRLVQRLSWYSVNDDNKHGGLFNGNLFDTSTRTLSEMGQNYARLAQAEGIQTDLYVTNIELSPTLGIGTGTPGSLKTTIRATIANAGNTIKPQRGIVRFYNGDPNAGGTQLGSDQFVNLVGCGDNTIASIEVESATVNQETITATVEWDIERIFMPLVNRQ